MTTDYLGVNSNRERALRNAAKCNPKPAIYIGKGVRGIDLMAQKATPKKGKKGVNHDEVVKAYQSGKTCVELSKMFDVSPQNISYILIKYHKINRLPYSPVKKEGIIDATGRLHKEGKSIEEIMEIIGCSRKVAKERIRIFMKKQ